MGAASVIHHTAIHMVVANTILDENDRSPLILNLIVTLHFD
jgi:hypothetical protein